MLPTSDAENWHCPHSVQSGVYVSVLRPSVCLSVCLSRSPAAAALLWARRAGDIDRLLHGRRCLQQGAQQRMRAVTRLQLTREAEQRLVYHERLSREGDAGPAVGGLFGGDRERQRVVVGDGPLGDIVARRAATVSRLRPPVRHRRIHRVYTHHEAKKEPIFRL